MKNQRVGNEVFVKGWTTCFDCGKRIPFRLRSDLAIVAEGLLNACIDCYWEEYADPGETPQTQKMIFRTIGGIIHRSDMR